MLEYHNIRKTKESKILTGLIKNPFIAKNLHIGKKINNNNIIYLRNILNKVYNSKIKINNKN